MQLHVKALYSLQSRDRKEAGGWCRSAKPTHHPFDEAPDSVCGVWRDGPRDRLEKNDMITVAGRIAVRPEQRLQAVAAAVKVTQATQRDTGCRQYHFYSDLQDPNVLHVFEEWESAEALAAHLVQPHTREFLAAIAEMVAKPPVITRYVVSESGSLV